MTRMSRVCNQEGGSALAARGDGDARAALVAERAGRDAGVGLEDAVKVRHGLEPGGVSDLADGLVRVEQCGLRGLDADFRQVSPKGHPAEAAKESAEVGLVQVDGLRRLPGGEALTQMEADESFGFGDAGRVVSRAGGWLAGTGFRQKSRQQG